MAKKTKKPNTGKKQQAESEKKVDSSPVSKNDGFSDYIFNMSYAPKIGEPVHWFQMLVIAFFGAFVIMIVHMHNYERDMSQFYWSGGNGSLSDFFSYYKMMAIIICAVLALLLLCYRLFTQSFAVKRCFAYIPMIIYSAFVLISYGLSDYKEFALLGYNDRFEGTLVLLAYMVMLFFVINSINSEYNAKWVIYPVGISGAILGILGVSQALDHDFFRTPLGQKLITPDGYVAMTPEFISGEFGKALAGAGLLENEGYTVNQLIDMGSSIGIQFLNFTFQNREIYQTVYNINYVSFYLTLLLPLFGMLFIRSFMKRKEEPIWKAVIWVLLFALLEYNLIGSASSGGLLGMGVVVLVALIVLNKKIIKWWAPVLILIAISVAIGGITYDRWSSELTGAVKGVLGSAPAVSSEETEEAVNHKLEYIDTDGNNIVIGIDGHTINIETYPDNPEAVKVKDQDGNNITLAPTEVSPVYFLDDERFKNCLLQPAQDSEGNNYLLFTSDAQEHNWPFRLTSEGVYYMNGYGALVDLDKIPAIGWEDNLGFGSGRGYIFSRTLPMMKDTVVIGHGADTYPIYFPHKDYVGKFSTPSFANNINIIVDKPHNMYMGAWVGTGGVSVMALLALFAIYVVQSFRLYIRNRFEGDDFLAFSGAGIFLGISGFLVSALVDDSSVSVMPMFYTLLGTGIAINILLRKMAAEEKK